jgi:hypothetical protein
MPGLSQAQHHYLLIPKSAEFANATPSDLTSAQLPQLKALHKKAAEFGMLLPDCELALLSPCPLLF